MMRQAMALSLVGAMASLVACNGTGGGVGTPRPTFRPGGSGVAPSPLVASSKPGLGFPERPPEGPATPRPSQNQAVGPFPDLPAPFPVDTIPATPKPQFTGPAGKVAVGFDEEPTVGWSLGRFLVRPRYGLAAVVVGGPDQNVAGAGEESPGRMAVLEGENRPSMELFDAQFGWALADGYDQTRGVFPSSTLATLQRGRSRMVACVRENDIWATVADTLSIGIEGIRADSFMHRYSLDGPAGPSPVQALLLPEPQLMAQAAGFVGDKLVAAGGTTDDRSVSSAVQIIDVVGSKGTNNPGQPDFARVNAGPSMPLGVAGAASVALGGKLYVMGGYRFDAQGKVVAQSAVQVYDGTSWTRDGQGGGPPVLPVALHSASATVLGGTIYLAGGCTAGRKVSNLVLSWRPDGTGSWVTMAPMPTPRALLALVAFDHKVWALGGIDGEGKALRTVEVLTP